MDPFVCLSGHHHAAVSYVVACNKRSGHGATARGWGPGDNPQLPARDLATDSKQEDRHLTIADLIGPAGNAPVASLLPTCGCSILGRCAMHVLGQALAKPMPELVLATPQHQSWCAVMKTWVGDGAPTCTCDVGQIMRLDPPWRFETREYTQHSNGVQAHPMTLGGQCWVGEIRLTAEAIAAATPSIH